MLLKRSVSLRTKDEMATQKERAESFKSLHEREGAFIIPPFV